MRKAADPPAQKASALKPRATRIVSLIRHAKSSWAFDGLDDLDRPLSPRGCGDAAVMGRVLAASGFAPGRWICSNALRALRTAEILAGAVHFDLPRIEIQSRLYHPSIKEIMALLRASADEVRWVACVGHNPELTALARHLGANAIDDLPTCGVVELHFTMGRWKTLGQAAPVSVRLEVPKNYRPGAPA